MQEKDLKERDCLSFQGFSICIRLDIGHRLGNAEVVTREVVKANDVKKTGLIIREDGKGNVTPAIYLEDFYTEYLKGRSLGQIEKEILSIYRMNCPVDGLDMTPFMDWEWVRERVVFRLVSMELNREYLKTVPYLPYLDFAVVFYCHLVSEELGEASIPICNSHLKLWGRTVEELYATAMGNTPKLFPPVIQGMDEVIGEMAGVQGGMGNMLLPMYVLSNRNKCHGAGCMLYEDVLREFAERMGTDLHILPSSMHEVLLIPATGEDRTAELDAMVCTVNRTQLRPEEVLSDHAYRFVRDTGEITMGRCQYE